MQCLEGLRRERGTRDEGEETLLLLLQLSGNSEKHENKNVGCHRGNNAHSGGVRDRGHEMICHWHNCIRSSRVAAARRFADCLSHFIFSTPDGKVILQKQKVDCPCPREKRGMRVKANIGVFFFSPFPEPSPLGLGLACCAICGTRGVAPVARDVTSDERLTLCLNCQNTCLLRASIIFNSLATAAQEKRRRSVFRNFPPKVPLTSYCQFWLSPP